MLAGLIAVSVHGNSQHFGLIHPGLIVFSLHWPALVAAMVRGCDSGMLVRVLLASLRGVSQTCTSAGALAIRCVSRSFAAFLIAVIGVLSDVATYGSCNEATRSLLENEASVPAAFSFFKFVATWLTAWSCVLAEVFPPSVSIGAALGQNIVTLTGCRIARQ